MLCYIILYYNIYIHIVCASIGIQVELGTWALAGTAECDADDRNLGASSNHTCWPGEVSDLHWGVHLVVTIVEDVKFEIPTAVSYQLHWGTCTMCCRIRLGVNCSKQLRRWKWAPRVSAPSSSTSCWLWSSLSCSLRVGFGPVAEAGHCCIL